MHTIKLQNIYLPLWIIISFVMLQNEVYSQEIYLEPAIQVNFGDPTADKPQSKFWTHNGYPYIVVADESGPQLWKKDKDQWQAQSTINNKWKGQPNKADVLTVQDRVYAVLVGDCELKIAHLQFNRANKEYHHKTIASVPIPDDCRSIETATITLDSKGRFWIASDCNEKILTWHSKNGIDWSNPITLAEDIDADDISLIANLKNQISVVWSNQKKEAIMERVHKDGRKPSRWSKPIIVEIGDKNADDHLNATVFEDGSMIVVSKNSADEFNKPQFVLRHRTTKGQWTNIPYENLPERQRPSRPIINHVKDGKIYAIHAVKDLDSGRYHISVNEVINKDNEWIFKEVVQLKTKSKGKNGDATSSKLPFSKNLPQLIFFSDNLGNVFEFDLRKLASL